MPKFDSVIVAPRNSSGGIERAIGVRPHAVEPGPQIRTLSRSPTLRSTGTMRPPSVSTAMPTSTRAYAGAVPPPPELYQALSAGSALQAAAMARTSRIVMSSPFGQSSISASSVTVGGDDLRHAPLPCVGPSRGACLRAARRGPAPARLRLPARHRPV